VLSAERQCEPLEGATSVIKTAHVITGLNVGGAETMLYRLLAHLDRSRFTASVITLLDSGPVADWIRALGLPVRALGLRAGLPDPVALVRLMRWLQRDSPELVHTWLCHADLLGGLAARVGLRGHVPIVWSIHASRLERPGYRARTIWTARICARLSAWLPTRIVCCSESGRRAHAALGYTAEKMTVIPNGFDVDLFQPDPVARAAVRHELGLPLDAPVVGLVARFEPYKDHPTFVQASAQVAARVPNVHFLLCGDEVDERNRVLAEELHAAGVGQRCRLLGRRDDMPRVNAALDVACSTSWTEAFPTVVGEAMACAVPCVVTDVGDSASMVGDTGSVVPTRDPGALAEACARLLALPGSERAVLGAAARERIVAHYPITAAVRRYESLYEELLHPSRPLTLAEGRPAK
jgi:glycosyltransferase involved in cell wall biosynthesis